MNKVILCGRLTRDPVISYTNDAEPLCIARYTLAVDRRQGDQQQADFINCVAFGRAAVFVEKYLRQGMKMLISGSMRTNQYTNKDGKRVWSTDIVVDEHEFVEKRADQAPSAPAEAPDEFVTAPEDASLPFA